MDRQELRIGDRVRVSPHAPATQHAGAKGVVVDLRRLDDEGVGCRLSRAPSGTIARIQPATGPPIEVPARLLEHLARSR